MTGDPIQFELSANGLNIGAPVNIRNAGTNTQRILGPNERIYLEFISLDFDSAVPTATLTIFDDGAVGSQNNVVDAGEARFLVTGVGQLQAYFCGDGIACGLGRIPTVISQGGPSSVVIAGTGRIQQG